MEGAEPPSLWPWFPSLKSSSGEKKSSSRPRFRGVRCRLARGETSSSSAKRSSRSSRLRGLRPNKPRLLRGASSSYSSWSSSTSTSSKEGASGLRSSSTKRRPRLRPLTETVSVSSSMEGVECTRSASSITWPKARRGRSWAKGSCEGRSSGVKESETGAVPFSGGVSASKRDSAAAPAMAPVDSRWASSGETSNRRFRAASSRAAISGSSRW